MAPVAMGVGSAAAHPAACRRSAHSAGATASTGTAASSKSVRSPVSGQVTAFNAPPGLFVQPGNPPAPYSVAAVAVKWMLANVPESESALFRFGQPVDVKVTAYPNHAFKGKVSKIYETVDPNTHRITIRSEIADPNNDLRPGMLA